MTDLEDSEPDVVWLAVLQHAQLHVHMMLISDDRPSHHHLHPVMFLEFGLLPLTRLNFMLKVKLMIEGLLMSRLTCHKHLNFAAGAVNLGQPVLLSTCFTAEG